MTRMLASALLMILYPVLSNAQLSEAELAKIAQNPLANLISVPFQSNINTGMGPFDRTQHILKIQPVIPFADGRIISRIIVPYVSQPEILRESGSSSGFSDISLSTFYTTSLGEVKVGIGAVVNLPTAAEGLGPQEWGLGPSLVAVIKPGNFVMGALVNNVWSIASSNLNVMLLQIFINYNMSNGSYLTTAPAITANWNAPSGNKWTIPVGMGVGKIVKLGGQLPLNLSVGGYYHLERPAVIGSDWSFKLSATVLLPTILFKKNKK